ncbi:DUF3618 domain-containing protein [Frankia sp. AiPs1]|uniref:DUF3618 domain-containing protein n=1 Tax=Frankia sp. AiPa1 TaxID=573492 RepID=UPI00202AE052|nr:DUF3618 domain-containing protein [Frankia sp. AiPa1]MCL9762896.1 DUF3618 domain-containing protein [Frankia sp. AiPa1]
MTSTGASSTSPDEIRSDIEATRARLGDDLDELSARVSPSQVAGRTAHDLRERVNTATNAVRPKVAAATGTATEKARHTADQAKATVRSQLDAHPQVAATAHRAASTAGSAAGTATHTVQRQLDAHPQVAAKVTQARDSAGDAVGTGRRKAAENPKATGLAAAGAAAVALLLTAVRRRRRRRRSASSAADAS